MNKLQATLMMASGIILIIIAQAIEPERGIRFLESLLLMIAAFFMGTVSAERNDQ